MSKTIDVLILEDSPDDAQILVFQLEESGLEAHWQRVETEEDFLAALDPHPDLILADYSLPSFSGIRALELRNERGLDIPFILVSGTMGEEIAVAALKNGAADYLLKDRLARLGEAAGHALEQKQLREEKRRAEQALRESEERLRVLSEAAHDLTTLVNRDWVVEYTNSYAAELFGVSPQDLVGKEIGEIFPAEIASRQQANLQSVFDSGQPQYIEAPSIFQGQTIWLGSWLVPIKDKLSDEANAILIVSRDITERKQAEQELHHRTVALTRSNSLLTALSKVAAQVASSSDMQGIMETLGKELKHLELDVLIALPEPDAQCLRVRYTTASGPGLTLAQNMVGLSLIGFRIERERWPGFVRVVEERLPSFVPNSLEFVMNLIKVPLPRQILHKALNFANVKSDNPILCLPLINNEQTRGTLMVWGSNLQESDTAAFLIFGAQIGAALENARLYESVQRELGERKQAEEALRQSQAGLETAEAQAHLGSWSFDPATQSGHWSREMFHLFGCDPALGVPALPEFMELIHPDDRERLIAAQTSILAGGESTSDDYRTNPERIPFRVLNAGLRGEKDGEGRVVRVVGTALDITDRKRAEEALRSSEEKYRRLTENAADIIFRYDLLPEMRLTYINPTVEKITGYTPQECLADPYLMLNMVHPDDLPQMTAYAATLTVPDEPLFMRWTAKDGFVRWMESRMVQVHDESGRLVAVEGITRDITERKQAEANLQASETRYRLATRATNDVIWEWNAKTREFLWSENAQHVFGYPPEEIGPDEKWWDEHVHPEDRQRVTSTLDEALIGTELIWSDEYRFLRRDGSYASIGDRAYIERDADGKPLRLIGAMSDITERQRAEERIQRQLGRLNALREIDHAIASTFDMRVSLNVLLSRTVKLLAVDAAAVLLLSVPMNTLEYEATIGFRTSAPQGLSIRLGESHAGKAAWEQRLVQIPDLAHERDPLFLTGSLQGEGFVSYHGAPLITKGKVVGVLEVFSRFPVRRDEEWLDFLGTLAGQAAIAIDNAQLFSISQRELAERRIAEDALRTSHAELERRVEERTAELSRVNLELERSVRIKDEFLANMSHELRTPLNAIIGLSESLEEQTAGSLSEKQQKYVHIVNESGHHLLDLINDILDIAKIESGQFTLDRRKLDVSSICESGLRMIRPLAQKKNQELVLDVEASLDLIWADELRLKQMLVNLLNNAVKFTPEQGRIGLEARGDREANTVSFTVWDTGIGIKEEDLAKLFQPFMQLKSELSQKTTGTGLGLALVAQMARLHGGSVGVESQPGQGSRFTLTLPWESPLATDSTSRMKMNGRFRVVKPEDKHEKQTILLVEDTEDVIMVIRDYLEYSGYKVAVARNGVDGIVQAKQLHPDLILMDIQMPDMDGLETTRGLRREAGFEHTPILALTALAMKGDRERCLAAGMDEYISKPVNLKALVRMIQSFV